MNYTEIKFENLRDTSRNWDRQSKNLMVFIKGSGNMFGGEGQHVHLFINGENSIYETGLIEVLGLLVETNTIARGENGPNRCWAGYYSLSSYEGKIDFPDLPKLRPLHDIKITGWSGGAKELIMEKYWAEPEFLVEDEEEDGDMVDDRNSMEDGRMLEKE